LREVRTVTDPRVVVVSTEELRELIVDAVRAVTPNGKVDEWVDARSSGLGRRLFLRLAREGAFPIFKRGRSYVAKRSDVDAYIERQRVPVDPPPEPEPPSPPPLGSPDPIAAALAAGRLRVIKKCP
jgi:hypothetical protein